LQRERARQALATVEEQATHLLQLDHLKSRFFADISHEFRTPLTLVIDPLENALQGDYGTLDDAFQQRLRVALRNARLVLRLINQVLDLARLEAASMELHAAEHDLVPLVRGIVQVFQSEAERLQVMLLFTPSQPSLPLYVDREKLEKIMFNLISNALKATPAGGKILVSVRQSGEADHPEGFAEIGVRDTGLGIPEESLPHIFNRFYRVDTPSTRHQTGTGIGLSLARELVELHRGRIEVESVPGFGSVFSVALPMGTGHLSAHQFDERKAPELPARPADYPKEDPEASPAPEAAPPDTPLVLVVEDNADVREMIRGHLSPSYRVAEAGDGLEALEKARVIRPALIISDVIMPGMEGIAFCRLLKQDRSLQDIPVILLTARASKESRMEGLEVGADDYITKPFDKRELLTRVENLIRSRRALRKQFSQELVLQPRGIVVPSEDAVLLERIGLAIEQHLEDPHFTVGALAAAVGMSVPGLKRKMRAIVNEPPVEYIRNFRLERAAQLLKQRTGNVGEVAFAVGFQNLSYFSKCFRDRFGSTPSQYAEREADGEAPT
jgi:DNA-binding response OmpR family regulator/nitrogen-specific signal transduction histidine kinase